MIYTFLDGTNVLGFGEYAEIDVKIEYICKAGWEPSWHDPGGAAECNITNYYVHAITSSDNEKINWSTLSPEKKEEVNNWVGGRVDSKEVHDACFDE